MRPINPVNNNGSIRIRFTLKGKTYSFNPVMGGEFNNSDDMRAAQAVATQIEADIRTGNFDPSLEKYGHTAKIQNKLDRANAGLKEMRDKQQGMGLWALWERYCKFKQKLVAPSTFRIDFGRRMNWLRGTEWTMGDAVTVRDWVIAHKPAKQARRILNLLAAACRWGMESGLVETNPFEGMAQNVPVLPTDEEGEINPFTPEEKLAVISAFESHPVYGFYAPLVRFLFATGCRPSEAIALEWEDLKGDKLTFRRTYSEGGLSQRLKTQKRRVIALSLEAQAIIEAQQGRHDRLVFPSPDGLIIDWHNFANRAWREVLNTLPAIDYRNPKQTRHTFITERILGGDSPANIAKYCGNSPGTIYRNYLGASRDYRPQ